jgi:hypothetical protein
MKYTTPPEGHRWHNPENAPDPPDGWRFCLNAEVREDQEWSKKVVKCRAWNMRKWSSQACYAGAHKSWSYIVPDTTPFDIPEAKKLTDSCSEDESWKADGLDVSLSNVMEILRDCAYPVSLVGPDGILRVGCGSTKREWFAGLAMQGVLANLSSLRDGGFRDEEVATFSSQMADALIEALNKKEETK